MYLRPLWHSLVFLMRLYEGRSEIELPQKVNKKGIVKEN